MKFICEKFICIVLMFCISFCIVCTTTKTNAAELDPNTYAPKNEEIDEAFVQKYGGNAKSFFFGLGVVTSIIAIMYVGIKYIAVGSLAQKAEYKKDIIPMTIGIVFIAMLSFILSIIAGIAESI